MELTGFPQLTVVAGIPVHGRAVGGSLRGEPFCEPGEAGTPLKF